MAITVIEQPQKFTPCGNDIIFSIRTDNNDIRYFLVDVLDLKGNKIASNKVYTTPTERNTATIPLSKTLSNKVFTDIDASNDVVKIFGSGIFGYKLSIKEESNGDVLVTDPYYTYNAKLNDVWFYDYQQENFVIRPNNEACFLTRRGIVNILHVSGKYFLYFILNTSNTLTLNIRVSYLNASTSVYRESIKSTAVAMGRINISPETLSDAYGIALEQVRSFEVFIANGTTPVTKKYTYRITGYPEIYSEVAMVWKNSEGGTDSYVFVNPVETKTSEKTTFSNSKRFAVANGVASSKKSVVNASMSSVYSVYSLMLSDYDFSVVSDIINSEQVFAVLSNGILLPVEIVDTSVQVLSQTTHKSISRKLNISFRSDSNMILNESVAGSIGGSFITQPKNRYVMVLAIDGVEDGMGILN